MVRAIFDRWRCVDDRSPRGTHQYDDRYVDEGHHDGDEQRGHPAARNGVHCADEKETDEVEHVQGGRERAAQLRLAHLAAVRYAQARGEAGGQSHQHRARVQGFRPQREQQQHQRRRQLDEIGQPHAHPVPEPVQHQRQEEAADRRRQVHQAPCRKPATNRTTTLGTRNWRER